MYRCGHARPLRLLEVLARNRQSALGLLGGTRRALLQTTRMFTIPPRQQLSITIWLAIRKRRVTRARIRNRIRNRIRIRVIIFTRMDFCFITTTKRDKTTNKSLMYKIYSTIEIKVIVNKYAASHTLNNHPPPLHSAGIATFGCLLSKCSFICFAFFINAMHT